MRVAGRRDIALRLVHHNVHLFLALEPFAVEADVVRGGVHLASEFGDNLAVDCYDSREDVVVGFPAGAYSRVGYVFVETNFVLDGNVDEIVVRVHLVVEERTVADHPVDALLGCPVLVFVERFLFVESGPSAAVPVSFASSKSPVLPSSVTMSFSVP